MLDLVKEAITALQCRDLLIPTECSNLDEISECVLSGQHRVRPFKSRCEVDSGRFTIESSWVGYWKNALP